MRKVLPLLGILVLLAASPVTAQDNYIGLFTDTNAELCHMPMGGIGQPVTVEVMAVVPSHDAVTAVEFRIEGMPESGIDGIWSVNWMTDLTIGNIEDGIAIALPDAPEGPLVHLGTITFIDISGSWVGDDHLLRVRESDAGYLVIVDDNFDSFDVAGGRFAFNCTDPDACTCLGTPLALCETSTDLLDFGEVIVGQTAEDVFYVTNSGDAPLELNLPLMPCSPDSAFQVTNAGSHIIGPGGSLDVHVRFQPMGESSFDCLLELGSDLCPGVDLSGLGVAAGPICALSTDNINFGPVPLGEDAFGIVTVSNTGDAPFELDLPATPCPGETAFEILGSGFFTVNPGAEHVVQIRFLPTEAGLQSCEFEIGGGCSPIALSGFGLDTVEFVGNHIGLYLDQEAQVCQAPLEGAGQIIYARILAVVPDLADAGEGITACEFRLDNLPVNHGDVDGIWTVEWTTELVIGEPVDGVALAWTEPQPGPVIELGLMTFYSMDNTDWVGADHVVLAKEALFGGTLGVVDQDNNFIPVGGGEFTFNCSDPEGCVCFEPGDPVCVLSDTELNFGSVPVDQSELHDFTISNQGDGVLTGFVQENCDDFELTSGFGFFSLAQGESHHVEVRFQPGAVGPASCEIDLGTEFCPTVYCFGVGWAPQPICQLVPEALLFDDIAAGTSQTLDFVISNIGVGSLDGFVSEDCADFSIIAGAGQFSLNSGQSRTVGVEFHPAAVGDYECFIDLGNDYCSQIVVTGQAHEPQPGCVIEPDSLNFGDIALGSFVDREAVIANTGDFPLEGELLLDDPHFALVGEGGPFNLGIGEQITVAVRYLPLGIGTHDALLTTGLEYCAELLLSGQAHEPTPTCELTPPALDFGDLQLGDLEDATFTISNDGDGPLNGEVSLDDPHFSVELGGGPFTVQPGEAHVVGVRFQPADYGPLSALVTMGSDICADLPLSGFGRNPVTAGDHIGIFADPDATICQLDLTVYTTVEFYLLAVVPSFADPGITGWEFRVAGLDQLSAADWTVEWSGFVPTGDIETGVQFIYPEAQPGEIVELGIVYYTASSDPGSDIQLSIEPSLDGLQRRVSDHTGLGWDVSGGRLTLNCTDSEPCDCIDFDAGICELSDDLLNFGNVNYGSVSYREFSITNVGFGPLAGDLQIDGEYFNLDQGEGPFLLGPGEVLEARAYFQPGGLGDYQALITTGLADCPEILCLGTGVGGGGGTPFMGLYSDEAATNCHTDLPIYATRSVYVSVVLPIWLPSITAAEFRVDNLPDESDVLLTENWATPLVIGDPSYGIALAFSSPLPGPVALMGTLDFFALNDLGPNYEMQIMESLTSGNLVVVGEDFIEYWCQGGMFTFNCSYYNCECAWATPVTLSSFELTDLSGSARIRWETETTGELEFRLLGARDGVEWTVPYSSGLPGSFSAEDRSAALSETGEVSYRLFGRLPGEDWLLLREQSLAVSGIAFATRLHDAHPNPFNPKVTIPYSLTEAGRARVAIYDVSGRLVATLTDGHHARGDHAVIWQGHDDAGREAGSGVYFVKMRARGYEETRKLVLLR